MPTNWTVVTSSPTESQQLGQCIASSLRGGIVIGLSGDLGTGKTQLSRAIAEGLGVAAEDISSPTFVLIHQYEGHVPVYHFDTYRLGDLDEFLELGVEELFESAAVCLVEWADRVREVLPADHLFVSIVAVGPEHREFSLEATGPNATEVLTGAQECWQRRLKSPRES